MTKENKETYKVNITGYAHDGAGVGRIDGQVVFVPEAIKGEDVLVEVIGKNKGILRGKIKKVINSSDERTVPICKVYSQCGGCQLQHVSYNAQLKIKEDIIRDTLKRIGGIDNVAVQPVLGMENPWSYRNKGNFQVGEKNGEAYLGFFEEGSHQIVSYSCQHLFSPEVTALVDFLGDLLTRYKVKIASEDNLGLCNVLIRESRDNGEIIVAFIYSGVYSDKLNIISQEIIHTFPKTVGICQSKNTKKVGAVLGKSIEIIEGKDWIEDKLGTFIYTISPASFFQVNNAQAEVLYEKVLEYAELTGKETVVDAYCGVGTISLFLAQKAKKVTGIEIVSEAVIDARKNAEKNNV
ncbi:MAG: 23S rRNA (uracil(1939)-C(5))-methyltransferase RlmD, partial [Clostridia bacterium]|nr:23S rRNA (uracil(1939)-C(5))-methyltransferase RlmD [Clostridia bacterium]